MAIDVSVQYNGGHLPDIILLTQCYYRAINVSAQSITVGFSPTLYCSPNVTTISGNPFTSHEHAAYDPT